MNSILEDIRPSPIAGQWYPANAERLADSVDGYLHAAQLPPLSGEVVAVMAPHAGHVYSGPVAGYAFAALKDLQPEIVAVVSPMHYDYIEPLLTTGHAAYGTPLGAVPVDGEALQMLHAHLLESLGFGLSPVRRDPEHSLEIELPFLQRALSGVPFRLLPVMVRDQSPRTARALGHALGKVLEGRTSVLVASSDLSHFYQQSTAEQLDHTFLSRLEAFDPAGVLQVEEEGKGFACGRAAVAAVLWAAGALGARRVQILHYATSGDINGDFSRVVGYAAAAVLKETTN